MANANHIVDILVEGRKNSFSRLIQQALGWDILTRRRTFTFTFAIGANIDETSMAEDGIVAGDYNWATESEQLFLVERNIIYALQDLGMSIRSDGHDDNGDLIGQAWINLMPPQGIEALKFMEKYLQGPEEPMRTSSGTLPSFIANKLFDNVSSEVVKKYTDVSVEFSALGELSRLFDLIHGGLTPDEAIDTMADAGLTEAFLGAPEPTGVFRSDLGGRTIFSAKCPGCKRIHGNFRTFEEAAGNKMCRYCIREYVDKIKKVAEKGNFKTLLKRDHAKARH